MAVEVFLGRVVTHNSPAKISNRKPPQLEFEDEPELPIDEQMKALERFHEETGGSKAVIKDVESIKERFRSRNRRHFVG